MIGQLVQEIPPHTNGGESLMLTTTVLCDSNDPDPKPDEYFLNQELSLQSYGNSASFTLIGNVLTPKILRELADEMEKKLLLRIKLKA